MAILKCKMCGGDILLSEDKTTGTCDHCGSTMTFPRVSDEQKLNLYNRANHFRRQNEFDKAITAYERILDQDDTDAEAHWGAVLSRYGIEYVEDPVTHERIPTCHRVQLSSILSDGDYLATLENAPDTASRDLYEQEARRIAEIQKGILSISSQEKPYDVFICYKETDDSGSRTKDSTLAQEIYYQLTNEGYKVFFSRITLEDKLGQQYEPYIFAALNSAKVMLVIGTKPEYLGAVWVKNEWSRYLALMKNDRSRLLIPCYRDMDAYDLPDDLSGFQSQDMSKIGFVQDLIRGVKKVLESKKQTEAKPVVQQAVPTGANIENLMKRARLFMEDGDFESANEYLDKVLDEDAEYAPAYAGKVCTAFGFHKESDLAEATFLYAGHPDWKKALRFATTEQRATYEGYYQQVKARVDRQIRDYAYDCAVEMAINPNADREKLYKEFEQYIAACATYGTGRAGDSRRRNALKNETTFQRAIKENKPGDVTEQGYQTAADMFRAIGDKEANERAESCLTLAEAIRKDLYDAAVKAMNEAGTESYKWKEAQEKLNHSSLSDYRDILTLRQKAEQSYRQCTEAEEQAKRQETERKAREAARAKARYIFLAILTVILAIAVFFVVTRIISLKEHYDQGISLRSAQKWEEAVAEFEQAGTYNDAKTQILATRYAEGEAKRAKQDWNGAVAAFRKAGAYSDAATQILATRYAEGKAKLEKKDWNGAVAAFEKAGTYSDAATQILATHYAEGEAKRAKQDWNGAVAAFEKAGTYSDAATQILATRDAESEAKLVSYRKIGNYVSFGTYPQKSGGNDSTPIEWLVLDYDTVNNRTLLISRYGLDAKPYNEKSENITWEKCTLRTWLNSTFYDKAFSANEQSAILLSNVDNSSSQGYSEWSTSGGSDTLDKIFLLSYAEAKKYFNVSYSDNNTKAYVYPTAYAIEHGAKTASSDKDAGSNAAIWLQQFLKIPGGKTVGWWWLRSPGNYPTLAANISVAGSLGRDGVSNGNGTIRPAFWLNLNADYFR